MNRCIDNDNCERSLTHKIIEYNAKLNEIDDGYSVIVNMKNRTSFFGYKMGDKWYDDHDEEIENINDIISFFDCPIPGFFARRH